ncbi:B12-binding domain-containing radical SAM protein [Candidatus Woesearchaeota archaeon]|nr:B12-binding domain-containing radical SAM protein [Candidatus Woesearchaeota archaeon]
MKILLVYPKYPETYWSFKHILKFVSKKAAFPPLGLLTVASMLPPDWEKKLVDANITELKNEHITWADLIFIGAMVVQKDSAREIIKRCKAMGKTVVAGGPLFTTLQEKFEGVDHFVLNEAEVTLPLFLEDLRNGNSKQVYTSMERPDVTKTPLPMWSLIDFKDYATMLVQYSRGCPFDCEFCDIIIMNGRIPRAKTPEQLITEFQALHDAGWRGSVFIVDDNFIGNKLNVKKMLPSLIQWQKEHNYPFKLLTEASTNLADDEKLMQMMSSANFYNVFLGIETPNIDSLKECGKFQNVSRDLSETVKTINRHGMQVMGGFIIGFDNDTESIFDTQISFIQQAGVVNAMVGLLNAIPETRLWHRLKAEGRLLNDPTGENTDGSLNFVPKMSREKLISGYRKILSSIYSPNNYYQRIETFLKSYKPTVRSRISSEKLNAFLKSAWSVGILSKARLLYWKLLLKTALTKTKAFPTAVELAIYGLHFERITKRVLSS